VVLISCDQYFCDFIKCRIILRKRWWWLHCFFFYLKGLTLTCRKYEAIEWSFDPEWCVAWIGSRPDGKSAITVWRVGEFRFTTSSNYVDIIFNQNWAYLQLWFTSLETKIGICKVIFSGSLHSLVSIESCKDTWISYSQFAATNNTSFL
jgi:hypothetical protein